MKGKAQQTESSNKTIRRYQSAKPGKQDPSALLKESDALALQRAIVHPTVAGPANILALQRAAGNRAVTGLIQTKLTVGAPGDRYEREADRVAEQVVSSQRGVQRQAEEELQTKPLAASLTPLIQCQAEEEEEIQTKSLLQRQTEEEEEVQMKPLLQYQAEEEEEIQTKPLLQRQAEEEEEIQTKSLLQRQADGGFEVGGKLESRLAARKGGGSPLPGEVRAFMEPHFGLDFSSVRVHTDSEAVQLNRELNAQAFTHGQDIYFNASRYNPDSGTGRLLLAHELAHTVQQGAERRISRWNDYGHKLVSVEALNRVPNVEQKFSNRVMEDIANGAGNLDHRARPILGIVGGTIAGKFKKLGSKIAGYSMILPRLRKRWERKLFEANAFHMRPKSELPNHGEAGAYRQTGQEQTNIERVNQWIDKAVAAAKKDNLGDTTKYLAYALHAAEDRGSHGEGNPGMGHDPRTKVPPEEAPGGVNEWYIDKGWDPDDLAKNANGKEFATQLAAQVLNDFYSRCNQKARDLIAFEFGSSFNLQEQLEKGRAKFKGGRGRTKGFPLGKGF